MTDYEFEERYGALKEVIQKKIEGLPPEYAKTSIKLYLENIAELFISLPVEELTQKFSEIFLEGTRTEAHPVKRVKNVIQKRADSVFSPRDKATKALFGALAEFDSDKFYTKDGDIKIKAGEINGVTVKVLIQINIEELLKHNSELALTSELTLFDRAVHDAVLTLNLFYNNVINENQIYRILVGYERHEKRPAPQMMIKAIKESLHRLRYTSVRINATDEALNCNYPALKKMKRAVFEGYLLPLNSIEVEFNNGQVSEAYEVLNLPPLYSYAGSKKAINNFKFNVWALPETIEATPQAIVIRNYLLEQIEMMKDKRNHRNSHILFDTLFKILDVEKYSKNISTVKCQKFRIRSTVEELLKTWEKPEISYIAGHVTILEGRKIAGVEIILNALDVTDKKLRK